MGKFFIATSEEIAKGEITDVYFQRALAVLQKRNLNPHVRMEVVAKGFAPGRNWSIFAGLEEVVSLLEKLPVSVRALEEGSVFYPNEPVMEIEGNYTDFCIYETSILGMLCQASGVATKGARLKKLAGERIVASFGARRMHPAIAPMIERSAFIGGCDGVSVVKSGEILRIDPVGTVPHSLILIFGSTAEAMKAYDEVMEEGIPRVAIIDTFLDEKFESINVASVLGKRLSGIRLDTPSSRRGNFKGIIEEVRWELNLRGYKHVKIFVSGGLDEPDLPVLNPVVDAYGIGTALSNAPVIDFSMDIIEIDGKPVSKRGKLSGRKSLLVCKVCGNRKILPFTEENVKCDCGGGMEEKLLNVLEKGKIKIPLPSPAEIRKKVLSAIEKLEV